MNLPPISLSRNDLFEFLPTQPPSDLLIADFPYGMTKAKWDDPNFDLPRALDLCMRSVKDNGAAIFFGSGVFTARMIMELHRMKVYRYSLAWEKTTVTGHLNAKKMPLRSHEDIVVAYRKPPTYNPQMTHGHERKTTRRGGTKNGELYGNHYTTEYDSTSRYPRSVIKTTTDKQRIKLSPTQKPQAILKWLISTYSNPGDTVLDPCMGSGATIIASMGLGRRGIGNEIDKDQYLKALEWVAGSRGTKKVFND